MCWLFRFLKFKRNKELVYFYIFVVYFHSLMLIMQEIQQAADFLEIPYLTKAIAASVQQSAVQSEHLRSYLMVNAFKYWNEIHMKRTITGWFLFFFPVYEKESGKVHWIKLIYGCNIRIGWWQNEISSSNVGRKMWYDESNVKWWFSWSAYKYGMLIHFYCRKNS